MTGFYQLGEYRLHFNNYARQELAKFILPGISPLPHPKEFSEQLELAYNGDKNELIWLIAYCGHLGRRFVLKDYSQSYQRFKRDNDSITNPFFDPDDIWLSFLESEGAFLQFSKEMPKGKDEEVRYEDILAYAFGELGLRPNEFYSMTMAEYSCMVHGYFWKRWRGDEYTRSIVYTLRSVFKSKKDTLPSKVDNFWPLPTDKAGSQLASSQEIKNMWERIKQVKK